MELVLEGPVSGPPKTGPRTRTGLIRTDRRSGPNAVQSQSWSRSYADGQLRRTGRTGSDQSRTASADWP